MKMMDLIEITKLTWERSTTNYLLEMPYEYFIEKWTEALWICWLEIVDYRKKETLMTLRERT